MKLQLINKYVLPSPAGAFYCVASSDSEPVKYFLQQLFLSTESPYFDNDLIERFIVDSDSKAEEILFHIQELQWLQVFEKAQSIPKGMIEEVLPKVLKKLSSEGKALLADGQGFYLSGYGFSHEASEELSALSGDLLSMYSRHRGIIRGNLNIKSNAFALVDAAGYSQLGFWPIYIGGAVFILIISGVPRLDQESFVSLVWILYKRYFGDN